MAVGHPQTVEPEKEKSMSETIEFAEFKRVEMKVGKVLEVVRHPGADKHICGDPGPLTYRDGRCDQGHRCL